MLRPWDLQIEINTDCERAVYIQIADAIIAAIKVGKLRSGDALPGSRQLATKLGLNRNTIVEALDVLLSDGWLIAKPRRGIFVADQLPTQVKVTPPTDKPMQKEPAKVPAIVFDDGLPDSRIAPINELAAAYRQIFNQKGRWQLMGYSSGSGEPNFREAIAQMLNFTRGMRLSADEIFITRGSQMAMYLSAHCLIEKGDYIVVENPGYKPAWQTFEKAGARLLPVSIDSDGLNLEELKAHLRSRKKIKGIYITPHHQFPTTVTLSFDRRRELVDLANHHGLTIIEDDYDHEFHFGQRPIFPVSSMEQVERYIYIGTMSKIVSPALRIGYLATSTAFLEKVSQLRRIIDVQNDNIMAQAILQLINEGHIKRHLNKATRLYKARLDFFEKALNQYVAGKVDFTKPDGGLAFWLVPRKRIDLLAVHQTLLKKGVQILSPSEYSFKDTINGLRLGYASLNEAQAEAGLQIISRFL